MTNEPLARVERYLNLRRHTDGQGNQIHGLFDADGEDAKLYCSDLACLVDEIRNWRAWASVPQKKIIGDVTIHVT